MSDVSGSGVAAEGSSYLTGYPLQDLGMYALARTWPAPEMPRPGCVWTHTLFIQYPDLATVSTPSRLNNLFVRPEGTAWSSYGVTARLDLHDSQGSEPPLSLQDEAWLAPVLNALYQFPQDRIVAKRDAAVSVEALTLRIWDQQWPRLRRSFRFCTFTTKDRSTSGGAFDLQVLPGIDSASRLGLPGTKEASPTGGDYQPRWLATLMEDARQPNLRGLRDTLKRLGGDTLGGREAMRTFSDFHGLTSGLASPTALHEAIEMLELPLLSSSELARAQVADLVLSTVQYADPLALTFLWDSWRYIDPARLRQRLAQVSGSLWRALPRRLLAALRDEADEATSWAKQIVKAVPAEELLRDWPEADVPLRELIAIRPDLLDVPAFWALADVRSSDDLSGIGLTDSAVAALIRGMERDTGMRVAVQVLGSMSVLDALQLRLNARDSDPSELRWVQHCVRDKSVIAEFLSRVQAPSVALLSALAGLLEPDAVPNQYGEDPWYTALLKVRDQIGTLPNDLAAYAFARALGWSSRNVAELLQMTFEQLHAAVTSSTLEESNWQVIEQRLPWVPEDKRWNRGGRLRSVVVSVFIDRRLWARSFARIATKDDVFICLMQEAADRWGGRRFLKNVEDSLEDARDAATETRRELIHSFVRSRGRL
jgi:hypothetical protein